MIEPDDAIWVARFHAGERAVLEDCYRHFFDNVALAANRILSGVDAETVTQEVFYRLLSDRHMRESFHRGDLGAWLTQIGVNAARDHLRRRLREVELQPDEPEVDPHRHDEEVEAKLLIERFRKEHLPPQWAAVFDARFLRQLPQRDAARELQMPRTSLVYQEHRIRVLLERFLLGNQMTEDR